MDYFDWRVQTELSQMEAAFGVKQSDFEYDGMADTGPLTQSTDASYDVSGGAESDEDQDLRADERDGLADASTAPLGVGYSFWSDDCTGGVSKYRLLDIVEECVLFRHCGTWLPH